MAIIKTNGVGAGRLIANKNGAEQLFVTTKSFLVLQAEGQEHILSHAQAAEWFDVAPYDPEFESWIDPVAESAFTPERKAFEAAKKLEQRKRFQELQRLPQFNLGFVAHLDVVNLSFEDHDEILRMYDQDSDCLGHKRSGFSAQQRAPAFKGQLIGERDQFWELQFGHNKAGAISLVAMDERIPHVWVAVAGAPLKTENQLRMLMRCAIKAILSFQVLNESRYGRDPNSNGLIVSPIHPLISQYPKPLDIWKN
jgi:hypothetical protein